MLKLPDSDAVGDARRVRIGYGRLVYVRSWRDLDHGMFYIEYTNARGPKTNSWKAAIVKEGVADIWDRQLRQMVPKQPVWQTVAELKKANVRGTAAYRILVYARDEEYMWQWVSNTPVRDFETGTAWMLGITETMYGLDFAQ